MPDDHKLTPNDIHNLFTTTEADRCRAVVAALQSEPWARPLLDLVGPESTWSRAKAGLFFELRIANELYRLGLRPTYEQPTGEGDRSVDFRFAHRGVEWYVEAVMPTASEALKSATYLMPDDDLGEAHAWQVSLSSNNPDQKQTGAGELLRLQSVLVRKAAKMPPAEPGRLQVVVADTRRVGLVERDQWDDEQLAYGPNRVPNVMRTYYNGRNVRGLFEPDGVPLQDASRFRERVHFLVLSHDEEFATDSLFRRARVLPNPLLFGSREAGLAAFAAFPAAVRPGGAG